MKKKTGKIIVLFLFGFALASTCQAADYILQAGDTYPQFRLSGTSIVIWGSAIQNATGFSKLVAETSVDTPYETIRSWYGTMLAAKLTDREVRICYDEGTGMITYVIPK